MLRIISCELCCQRARCVYAISFIRPILNVARFSVASCTNIRDCNWPWLYTIIIWLWNCEWVDVDHVWCLAPDDLLCALWLVHTGDLSPSPVTNCTATNCRPSRQHFLSVDETLQIAKWLMSHDCVVEPSDIIGLGQHTKWLTSPVNEFQFQCIYICVLAIVV